MYPCMVASMKATSAPVVSSETLVSERVADGAGYSATFQFFSSIADFGSDVKLTLVFFILSLIFSAVGLYFIEKWRNEMDAHMLPHLKTYDVFLICITVGFYSAVELASSRLFYLKMFVLLHFFCSSIHLIHEGHEPIFLRWY